MAIPNLPPIETVASTPSLIDTTTVVSLAAVALLLTGAYILSRSLLSGSTPSTLRLLFIWHAFDALVHFTLEGSFLYNTFFTYTTRSPSSPHAPHPATITSWLGYSSADRLYGSAYGSADNYFAKLWMVYADADKRWGVADANIVSLELLTVFIAGPMAAYICYLIWARNPTVDVWMIVLGTMELYGGWMTFCPEWLTGNPNLDGGNFMFLWVYLVFFNMLWVFLPVYAIYVGFEDICNAFNIRNAVMMASLRESKKGDAKAS